MTRRSVTRISAYVLIFSIAVMVLTSITRVSAQPADGAAAQSPDSDTYQLFLPLVQRTQAPAVNLDGILTTDTFGTPQLAFLSGDNVNHQVAGTTLGMEPITATLQISETGPCGSGVVYSDTLSLPPGSWGQTIPALAPGCTGVFTTTATVSFNEASTSMSTQFVVNEPFSEIYYDGHGFDRCIHPTTDEMQTWWDHSPYSIFNLYLGGIHYPSWCMQQPIDAFWVHEVANQGWSFTATWVGPQAPCSGYTYKINSNPAGNYQAAYIQGESEAINASIAARSLGLFGDLAIIYDLEGYSGSTTTQSCRDAVSSFMQGWTDRLQILGFRAGGYGSPCSSYISDWHANTPTIDQIWIAHWYLSDYNPNASVWGEICGLEDTMWENQQRLKQYAGDHTATWGGISMDIDSNVFDTTATGWGLIPKSSYAIEEFGMLTATTGWARIGTHIYVTFNSGDMWEKINPPDFNVLSADFIDPLNGWLLGRVEGQPQLKLALTEDGGNKWQYAELDTSGILNPWLPASGFVEALDRNNIWVALKLQSGSSFSIGRLLASEDGGRTWELREMPLGEPAHFSDSLNGWTAGGPAGNAFFETQDGGRTWQSGKDRTLLTAFTGSRPAGTVKVQSPDGIHAWALVQEGSCAGPKEAQVCFQRWQLMETTDGGHTWTVILSRE